MCRPYLVYHFWQYSCAFFHCAVISAYYRFVLPENSNCFYVTNTKYTEITIKSSHLRSSNGRMLDYQISCRIFLAVDWLTDVWSVNHPPPPCVCVCELRNTLDTASSVSDAESNVLAFHWPLKCDASCRVSRFSLSLPATLTDPWSWSWCVAMTMSQIATHLVKRAGLTWGFFLRTLFSSSPL